MFLKV